MDGSHRSKDMLRSSAHHALIAGHLCLRAVPLELGDSGSFRFVEGPVKSSGDRSSFPRRTLKVGADGPGFRFCHVAAEQP